MPWGYLIAQALTFIFSFALGIFTLLINPRSRVHQLWFLTTLGVSIWSGGVIAVLWSAPDERLGLLFSKLLHIGSTMIIVFFLHFVLAFLAKVGQRRMILLLAYLIGAIFTAIIFSTTWFVKGVAPKSVFAMWIDAGPWYAWYAIYYVIFVLFAVYFLSQGYREMDGIKKQQIFFILLAAIVGFGGGLTNFLPQLFGIFPFGTYVIPLYPLLITYGIFLPEVRIRV